MKTFIRVGTLLILLLSGMVLAQVTDSSQDQQPQVNDEPAAQVPVAPTDVETDLAEPETENEEQQDADAQARFIPTEQISQDLGVSFPVDI